MTLASIGYVGYGVETTEGTIVAPSVYLPVSAFSFDSTNDYIIPEQLRGSRDTYVAMASPYAVSGTMDMELVSVGTRPLLQSALSSGAYTPSAYAGGGYLTVFTPGVATAPTFSFESSAGDILVMRYGGIRVNTLEISAAFGEIVTASFGLEGTTRAKQAGVTTETYASVMPFHFTGASMKAGGVELANIKNFSFSVGNNLERVGTLKKTRSWRRTALGKRDIGLSATMDFTDTADYDLFLAETEFAVELHLESDFISGNSGPKHTIHILLPRVRWNSVNAPITAGSMIEQSVEAMILRPLSNASVCTVNVVNTESAALV